MFVIELKSKQKFNAAVKPVCGSELIKIRDFDFDWAQEADYEVFKLIIPRTGEVLGLLSFERIFEELRIEIRLLELSTQNIGSRKKYDRIAGIFIAFCCKESFQNGFYGFVSLVPKTRLIKHYIEKYGFEYYGNHLAVDLKRSELLMNKYLLNE